MDSGSSSANINDGETDVAVGAAFVITFTAPVDTESVTERSFFIVPDLETSSNLSFLVAPEGLALFNSTACNPALAITSTVVCPSETSCNLTPDHDLDHETNYILCLTENIRFKDLDSGTFEAQSLAFKTEEALAEDAADFAISGTVTGLNGTVVLQNNGGDDLSFSVDGDFQFATSLPDGATYAVTVLTSPANQTCVVTNDSGTVSGAYVSNVVVTCLNLIPTLTSIAPDAGTTLGGEAVTLTGTHLTGTTALTFGGLAATSLEVVNDTTLTAITPAHDAGAVDIVATTPLGDATLTDGYSYAAAVITVTGSPLILIANGATDVLTINNTSLTITAVNITSNFTGTTLDGNVTETGNTCNTLPPSTSCTLTYTPGNTAVAQTDFIIQGSNTNSITAAMTILAPAPTVTSVSPASGSSLGGTSVTITGTNFTDATAVNFGSSPAASFILNSDTNITAISPAGAAGSIDMTVTTPSGTSTLSSADEFTYVNLPDLTNVSPSSGTASGGTGVTLTGTNLTGTTGITFGGVAATSVNVVDSTTVTAVTPAHAAGAVDVVITTPDGDGTLSDGYTYLATSIGQSAFGGTIACLNGGLNNMIAATADNSTAIIWGGSGTTTSATSTTDGATNTATIVASLGANGGTPYAAQLCDNYETDSQGNTPCEAGNTCYNDWYLPSANNTAASGQLNCLYTNRASIGGFAAALYSSSTEANATNSWVQSFVTSAQASLSKNASPRVRCVRGFTP